MSKMAYRRWMQQWEPLDLSVRPRVREVAPNIANEGTPRSVPHSEPQTVSPQEKSIQSVELNMSNNKTDRVSPASISYANLHFLIELLHELTICSIAKPSVNLVIHNPRIPEELGTPNTADAAAVPAIPTGNSNKRQLTFEVLQEANKRQKTGQQEPELVTSFPATKGTEHPIKGILYQVPAVGRRATRWLMDWDVPNWVQGPTVVEKMDLNDNILYKKHNVFRGKFIQWKIQTQKSSSYCKEIEVIHLMALELLGVNGVDDLKLYYLFVKRFLVGDRDQNQKKWSDWQKWHLFAYKRYLEALKTSRGRRRPLGESKNYGWANLFAICFYVGSNEGVSEFAQHVNEIE